MPIFATRRIGRALQTCRRHEFGDSGIVSHDSRSRTHTRIRARVLLAAVTPIGIRSRFYVIESGDGDREEKPVTIGADLRSPLFVDVRVSSVPDTLTFSRKHSCLHSCSLGRDTHYSPFPSSAVISTRRPPPPRYVPPRVFHLSTVGCHTELS